MSPHTSWKFVVRAAALCAILVLAACGGERATTVGPALDLDELPTGVGRGFPAASVEQSGPIPPSFKVGDMAPNFYLTTADGRTLTMDSLRGRPVIINHWATWCGPCRLEMPELVEAARTHPDLVVIAANHMEAISQVEPFAREYAMEFPVAIDAEGRLSELFAVRAFPTTLFIDREGRVAAQWIGLLTAEKLDELLAAVL